MPSPSANTQQMNAIAMVDDMLKMKGAVADPSSSTDHIIEQFDQTMYELNQEWDQWNNDGSNSSGLNGNRSKSCDGLYIESDNYHNIGNVSEESFKHHYEKQAGSNVYNADSDEEVEDDDEGFGDEDAVYHDENSSDEESAENKKSGKKIEDSPNSIPSTPSSTGMDIIKMNSSMTNVGAVNTTMTTMTPSPLSLNNSAGENKTAQNQEWVNKIVSQMQQNQGSLTGQPQQESQSQMVLRASSMVDQQQLQMNGRQSTNLNNLSMANLSQSQLQNLPQETIDLLQSLPVKNQNSSTTHVAGAPAPGKAANQQQIMSPKLSHILSNGKSAPWPSAWPVTGSTAWVTPPLTVTSTLTTPLAQSASANGNAGDVQKTASSGASANLTPLQQLLQNAKRAFGTPESEEAARKIDTLVNQINLQTQLTNQLQMQQQINAQLQSQITGPTTKFSMEDLAKCTNASYAANVASQQQQQQQSQNNSNQSMSNVSALNLNSSSMNIGGSNGAMSASNLLNAILSPSSSANSGSILNKTQQQQQSEMMMASGLQTADWNFLQNLQAQANIGLGTLMPQQPIPGEKKKAKETLSHAEMKKLYNSIDKRTLPRNSGNGSSNVMTPRTPEGVFSTTVQSPDGLNTWGPQISTDSLLQNQPAKNSSTVASAVNSPHGLRPQQLNNIIELNNLAALQNQPDGDMDSSKRINSWPISPMGGADSGMNNDTSGIMSPMQLNPDGTGANGGVGEHSDGMKIFLERKKRGYSKQKQMAVFHYTLRHARQYMKMNNMPLEWNFMHLEEKRKIDLRNGIKNPIANISPLLSEEERAIEKRRLEDIRKHEEVTYLSTQKALEEANPQAQAQMQQQIAWQMEPLPPAPAPKPQQQQNMGTPNSNSPPGSQQMMGNGLSGMWDTYTRNSGSLNMVTAMPPMGAGAYMVPPLPVPSYVGAPPTGYVTAPPPPPWGMVNVNGFEMQNLNTLGAFPGAQMPMNHMMQLPPMNSYGMNFGGAGYYM